MSLSVLREFAQPPAAYRGKPFWAWNGKLEPEELRRQVRLMHHMGLGGFFMHSRVGLDTAYLSPEWFVCVKACLDEAEQLGMEAWLYDEDRWPSGAAGGLVTRNPAYRMRSLVLTVLKSPQELTWDRQTVAVLTAFVKGDRASRVELLAKGERPAQLQRGQVILRFAEVVDEPSSWYNGYTYLDTMNRAAVRKFLEVTHEAYRERIGRHFGRLVPGIFTDEPNYGRSSGHPVQPGAEGVMPWTSSLLRTFRRRYGYDLRPHLAELFFDVEGQPVSPARYHYHDCTTFLFVDAFARQVGEWCEQNRLLFTGHVLEEDTLASQVAVVGSAMRFYEHMQAPGMDLLTERWRLFDTAKQVSSAARQFGRRWRLTETYGCTGWDFPFAAHKALGDWQVALGLNLRCPHLAWYTMLGEAKRDYPAGIFYQSPWWELYPPVEDYFARVLAVMTRGREVRDLLVLHPIESMWLLCKSGWLANPETHAYNRMLSDLSESLLAGHVDFDYGDEELLSRHAHVRKRGGQAELVVGKATYRMVLVPPLKTMRASTLALLEGFRRAGGEVVFAGEAPAFVDARPSEAARTFAADLPQAPAQGPHLVQSVETTCRRVSIADPQGREIAPALYLLREDPQALYLFVCNTGEDFVAEGRGIRDDPLVRDRTAAFPKVVIRGLLGCAGAPLELDPETGAAHHADAVPWGKGWEIHTSLPALGSRLFVIPKRPFEGADFPAVPRLRKVRARTLTANDWPVRLSEANNLVLDRPRYRVGDGPWRGPQEILRVDRAVRAALGVPARGGAMVQPWARKKTRHPQRVSLALAYSFRVEAVPTGELFLGLERPDTFRVALNGVPASTDAECGWWVDRSLRRIPLDPALLREGDNELLLECDYAEDHSGLEIVYLLGQFGTRVEGTDVVMTAPPTKLSLGDWCEQGLAFYSGSVTYRQTLSPRLAPGERLFVRVPSYRGVAVRVLVDGVPAGIVAWEPHEVEITELVGAGRAALQIEVIGHRRNSHGPFHLSEKWPTWTGPGQYQAEGDAWFEGYQLVPCGLMAPPELITRR